MSDAPHPCPQCSTPVFEVQLSRCEDCGAAVCVACENPVPHAAGSLRLRVICPACEAAWRLAIDAATDEALRGR